jgi:hypothetical protein
VLELLSRAGGSELVCCDWRRRCVCSCRGLLVVCSCTGLLVCVEGCCCTIII